MSDLIVEKKELQDFEPHVGTVFSVVAEGLPPLAMTLEEAKGLKASDQDRRPPYQLIFRGSEEVLPQGLYRFRHDAMGDLVIFIVPTGKNESGVEYCATFN